MCEECDNPFHFFFIELRLVWLIFGMVFIVLLIAYLLFFMQYTCPSDCLTGMHKGILSCIMR